MQAASLHLKAPYGATSEQKNWTLSRFSCCTGNPPAQFLLFLPNQGHDAWWGPSLRSGRNRVWTGCWTHISLTLVSNRPNVGCGRRPEDLGKCLAGVSRTCKRKILLLAVLVTSKCVLRLQQSRCGQLIWVTTAVMPGTLGGALSSASQQLKLFFFLCPDICFKHSKFDATFLLQGTKFTHVWFRFLSSDNSNGTFRILVPGTHKHTDMCSKRGHEAFKKCLYGFFVTAKIYCLEALGQQCEGAVSYLL